MSQDPLISLISIVAQQGVTISQSINMLYIYLRSDHFNSKISNDIFFIPFFN